MLTQELIQVGKISGVFGVKGWVKVFSYTEPRDNILNYKKWLLKKGDQTLLVKPIDGQIQGKGVIAQIDGITDRDEAVALMGWDVHIRHEDLPAPEEGEYYWTDLIGLDVENLEGFQLGKVDSLIETGANDVLVVKGERELAVPFLQGQTVKSIDLATGKMIVDWDADF
ncbi:ribosome maturation factor RimM [Methyloglobulus morosus]|uniref:ribosome maturation factor RimM n=1 Tax=Methyloglobulus morosus TaxID=1410681 RepID=UPI0004184F3F|nr:ribosome maturation factor RimM [Methyloglobulus morosus]